MQVDCHVHVVGAIEDHPQSARRTYTALPAPLDHLLGVSRPTTIGGFVVVQPSFYGTDNSLTLGTVDRLGRRGRAVVAVDADSTTEDDLQALFARGAQGLRLNHYSALATGGGESLTETVERYAALPVPLGMHLEVMAPLPRLLQAGPALADAAVPIVIDHYGLVEGVGPAERQGQAFLELAALDHVHVKLSAPYRSATDPLEIQPARGWLDALLAVAPARCVWGSDWPFTPPSRDHLGDATPVPYRDLPYQAVFERFAAALGDHDVGGAVFETNPARLYGFDT